MFFSNRIRRFMAAFAILGLAFSARPAKAETNVDWDSLRAAYALYSKAPTDSNAAKVSSYLPKELGYSAPAVSRRNHAETEKFFLNGLGVLEGQIFRSKANSVMLAFRLYSIADGEFAESLDITLGKLVCRNPRLFLQQLKVNRHLVARLDTLLMNYGADFADDDQAQAVEYRHRLKCIRKVRDPELQDIRDECVEFMEENP
jgi:hypothetical protein